MWVAEAQATWAILCYFSRDPSRAGNITQCPHVPGSSFTPYTTMLATDWKISQVIPSFGSFAFVFVFSLAFNITWLVLSINNENSHRFGILTVCWMTCHDVFMFVIIIVHFAEEDPGLILWPFSFCPTTLHHSDLPQTRSDHVDPTPNAPQSLPHIFKSRLSNGHEVSLQDLCSSHQVLSIPGLERHTTANTKPSVRQIR